jgi:hypothetical protein
MTPSQEEIDKLEQQYGRIAVVRSANRDKLGYPEWTIVLRKPNRGEYKMFRAQTNNPAQKADAQETFIRQTCVVPDRVGLDALLEEYPGIADSEGVTEACKALTGLSSVQDAKT